MNVLVFANGELSNGDWIIPYLEKADKVIAADGGAKYLLDTGRYPDIIIGDLDSVNPDLLNALKAANTKIVSYPTDKDETDLELALAYAAGNFQGDILIFGFLGGRLDQTLGNIMLLAHPALQGRSVTLVDKWQAAWLVETNTQIIGTIGDTVSLVPFGGNVRVAKTTGLKWNLMDETLSFGPARGVSNMLTDDKGSVAISSGRLLCIHTKKGWGR